MSDIQSKVAEVVALLKESHAKIDTINNEVLEVAQQYIDTYDELSGSGNTVVGIVFALRELGLIEFKEIK